MFGSDILDVSIGIVFVFVLVSTICSAVRESLEAFLKTRASYLEFGIRQLLSDAKGQGLAKELFEHPLIFPLFAGEYVPGGERRLWWRGRNLPSYIPSRSFAVALMDVLNTSSTAQIANPRVQRAVQLALDAAHGNLEQARQNVEAWYDSAMDRVSGWYKRSTQWIIFAIALVIAVGANIDTLAIADYLYRHEAVRSTIVETVKKTAGTAGSEATYGKAMDQLEDLHLPIGWTSTTATSSTGPGAWAYVRPLIGWLITAFAATLGAPFWFDLLNKIMVIRSTVKPHEKSGEEGSEDRKAERTAAASGPAVAAAAQESDADPCRVGGGAATPDERLPAAEGGVA
jgi:hypothetical protein